MALRGVYYSDSGLQGDRKDTFTGQLLETQAGGTAPLFAISGGFKSTDISNTVYTWFEKNTNPERANIVTNIGTATTFAVLDASWIVAGQVFQVESTGEHLYVVGVTGNNITAIRGFASTAVANINGSAEVPVVIRKIGTAYEENSNMPQAVASIGFSRLNYTQIFRNAWAVSGTAEAAAYNLGNIVSRNKLECMEQHANDIEKTLIWGKKEIGASEGSFRAMDGIDAQIKTNRFACPNDGFTFDLMNIFCEVVFDRRLKGYPQERIALCGNGVIAVVNKIVASFGGLQYSVSDTTRVFGFNIVTWVTPWGELKLLTHPLMNESPVYRNSIYVVHPAAISLHYLRRTKPIDLMTQKETLGRDGVMGGILTEMTMSLASDAVNAYYSGIEIADLG